MAERKAGLNVKCPFCGQPLKIETYSMKEQHAPTCTIYCDHDDCTIKPSTIDTSPSLAFADVKAWGSKGGLLHDPT